MAKLDYGTSGVHGLSYSRLQTFKSCPRKFELAHALGYSKHRESVTFSFGHAVGGGAQGYFRSGTLQGAVIEGINQYTYDWSDAGTSGEQRAKKSVAYAVAAIEKFVEGVQSTVDPQLAALADYELAYFTTPAGEHKPAIELQFRIVIGDYSYEGHIDAILKHKHTGKYLILELKTTSLTNLHPAQYQNSDQALSYSIVLDAVVGSAEAEYDVLYAVYSTGAQQWSTFNFHKTAAKRLDWLNNLQRTVAVVEMYQEHSTSGIPYPTNGDACYNFFSPCEFFNVCHLDNSTLETLFAGLKAGDLQFAQEDNCDFVFQFDEIVAATLERINNAVDTINTSALGDSNGQFIEL